MANYTFPQWILYGSGWQTSYKGTGSISVSRATGSNYATISASMAITSPGGDNTSWTFHCAYKNASGNWVQILSKTFSGGTYHYPGSEYTASGTYNLSVGTTAGSVELQIWMSIDGYESYTGGSCTAQGETFSYASKGESTVTGDSAATISPTGSSFKIKWTPNASDFRFWYRITVGSTNVDSAWIYPQTTSQYTCTVSLNATDSQKFIKAINTSASANATITLYTCPSSSSTPIGTSSYTCKFTVSADVKPAITGLALSGKDTTFNLFITGSTVTITATVSQAYNAAISTVYAVVNGTTHYGTYVSATSWTINLGTFSPSSSCVNYTANVYITDARGRSNSNQTSFDVYRYTVPSVTLTGNSSSTAGTYILGLKWSCTEIDGNTGTATLTRDSTTVWTGSGRSGDTSYTDTSPSSTTTYTYTLTVADRKNTTTKTWVTGVVGLSLLRGGTGARFFGEAQASDAGWVNVQGSVQATGQYQAGHANGYMLNVAKDNNKTIQSYFCTGGGTSSLVRGLWDNTDDGISTRANWWCYLSDTGNINIGNYENRANRNIYLNSNKIYGYVDGTTYRMDWIYTTAAVNGWTCRKHVNGIWECTRDVSVTGAFTTAYGSMYRLVMDAVEWPATLTSTSQVISCTLTRVDTNGNNYCWVGDANGVKTNKTQDWLVYKAIQDTTSRTYTFRIHAILIYGSNEEEE